VTRSPAPDGAAPEGHVLVEPGPGEVLLVALSGHFGQLAGPVFEFARALATLPAGRLVLREALDTWYHRGIPGVGPDIGAVRALVERHVATTRPRAVVGVGASAGGYAALLFGALLGFDEVHAFSPQTTLDRWQRLRMRDLRWPKDSRRLSASGAPRELLDLRPILASAAPRTAFHVHYCRQERLDRRHAERLAGLPRIALHAYDGGGHHLARWLHERGDLLRVIEQAVRR
jgi:hypothetical protein